MTALPRTDAEPHPWGPRDGKGGRAHPVPFALPRGSPCSPRRLPNGPRVKILRAGPWDRLSLPPAFRVSPSLLPSRAQEAALHPRVPANAFTGPCSCNLGSLRLQLCAEALRPPGSWSPETGVSQELMCRPVRRWGTAPGSDGRAPLPTRYAAHPTGSRLVMCSLDVQRENDPFLLRSCSSSPASPTHAGLLKVIAGWTHLGTSAGCPRLGPSAPAFPFHKLVSRKIPF